MLIRLRQMLTTVLLITISASAAAYDVVINYTPASQYEDGKPLPLAEIAKTRLMCDGVWVAEEPGADGTIGADLSPGIHECAGSHVAVNGKESILGNVLIVNVPGTVVASAPKPPYLSTANVGYAQKE